MAAPPAPPWAHRLTGEIGRLEGLAVIGPVIKVTWGGIGTRVRKPSVDGIITRFEGFDADGEWVIPLFGVPWPKPPLS